MNERRIGKLAEYLRKEQKISMKKIYQGICTESMYFRMETGESMPDFQTLICLFGRLSKSIDKISMIISEEDYEIYCLQENIQDSILENKNFQAEELIENYENREIAENPCHYQFILKMKAAMLMNEGNYNVAKEVIEKALANTIASFDINNISSYLLNQEEWILIFMWIKCESKLKKSNVFKKYRNIIKELGKRTMDIEFKLQVFPKAALLFAEIAKKQKELQEAEKILIEAYEFLREESYLLHLEQILDELIKLKEKQQKEEGLEELKRKLSVLRWIYESAGKIDKCRVELWDTKRNSKVYLITETVIGERMKTKMTKSKLADKAGLDVRTLSRIEGGRHFPKPGTFQKIMNVVDREYDIYGTSLITDDFSLLEIRREIAGHIMKANYTKARRQLGILKEKLSLAIKENRQYIMYTQNMIDIEEGKINLEEGIRTAVEALEITRKFDEDSFETSVLGVEEAVIVNYIAKLYRRLGEEKRAIQLLEKALTGFDSSLVSERHRSKEVTLLLESLAMYCETSDMFDKASYYCNRGIQLEIECCKGGTLGNIFMQRIFIAERLGKEKEECKKEYCIIAEFLDLMKMWEGRWVLERYYYQQYGTHIADDIKLIM